MTKKTEDGGPALGSVGKGSPFMKQRDDLYAARIIEEREAGRESNARTYESMYRADLATWINKCGYLLDVLEDRGFLASDLSEDDEDTIVGIRAAVDAARKEGREA